MDNNFLTKFTQKWLSELLIETAKAPYLVNLDIMYPEVYIPENLTA